MTYKELKEKFPGSGFITEWGEDTKGGFGKKGWSAYGNGLDRCKVMEWKQIDNETYKVILADFEYSR